MKWSMVKYPDDRIEGHVWHAVYMKDRMHYWVTGATRTPAGRLSNKGNGRKVKRLVNRVCKVDHLNPRLIQQWWIE